MPRAWIVRPVLNIAAVILVGAHVTVGPPSGWPPPNLANCVDWRSGPSARHADQAVRSMPSTRRREMATEQIRTIRCSACGHDYEITRVMTIDGNAVRIDDPSLWATAYCPSCGQPAQVLQQEVGDADR